MLGGFPCFVPPELSTKSTSLVSGRAEVAQLAETRTRKASRPEDLKPKQKGRRIKLFLIRCPREHPFSLTDLRARVLPLGQFGRHPSLIIAQSSDASESRAGREDSTEQSASRSSVEFAIEVR
jgi:hypothetical protein